MYHMLSCFNLKSGVTLGGFQKSLEQFSTHLEQAGLVHKAGAIGKRHHHEIMDTDHERDHEYFFILSFEDRSQCDRSVEHIQSGVAGTESKHNAVFSKISDPVFICWEDV